MSSESSARQHVVITDARSGASKDHDQRVKRYAITMGFRTACFVAMIFVPGVFKWILLGFAIFLPGIAVLLANQANQRTPGGHQNESIDVEPLTQLTTGHYETVEGETVEGDPSPDDRTRAA